MPPTNATPPISRESTRLRLTFLTALVISFFVLLVARLWFLQVMTGSQFVARAEGQIIRTIELAAPRGDILDREGVPIVDNRFAQIVSIRPDQLGDAEERAPIIAELSGILAIPEEEIIHRIEDPTVGPFANRPIAIDVPDDVIFYIHQNGASRFPGVIAERIPVRDYARCPDPRTTCEPQQELDALAPHVVGYTGQISAEQLEEPEFDGYESGDIIGWTGVEAQYEQYLQGTKGRRQVRVNAAGEIVEELGEQQQALAGDSVQLTIDIDVQRLVQDALQGGIQLARQTPDPSAGGARAATFSAPAGSAIVLDPATGEIVAMASYPTFDPESFVGGIADIEWDFLQDRDSHFPLINRAISASYPPGSVYKIVTAAAALTYGFAEPDDYIDCPAVYQWEQNRYRNWNPVDSGSLNIAEALQQSCDTVFYALARRMFNEEVNTPAGADYNERASAAIATGVNPEAPFEYLAEMSRAWGLDEPSGIDLPGERGGVVPGREWRFNYWLDARESYCYQYQTTAPGTYSFELFEELCEQGYLWRGGDEVNMAIGQGDMQTTPLQVANMFAAVANRGFVMRPHVVRAVLGRDEAIVTNNPTEAFTVPVASEDLAFIEQGLTMVTSTESGTAFRVFGDFPILLAGKTGTAEQQPRQPFAWFGAYNVEPVNGERYVVVAFVEEGGGGSLIAAPIVKRIFGGLFNQAVELEAGVITD